MPKRRLSLYGLSGQIGSIAVTLLGLLLLTFFIGRLMPADPVRAIVGEDATRETYEQVYHALGFDRPLWQQFIYYLGDVFTGDFGTRSARASPSSRISYASCRRRWSLRPSRS